MELMCANNLNQSEICVGNQIHSGRESDAYNTRIKRRPHNERRILVSVVESTSKILQDETRRFQIDFATRSIIKPNQVLIVLNQRLGNYFRNSPLLNSNGNFCHLKYFEISLNLDDHNQ